MLKKIIIHADNMQVLPNIKDGSINLVYIDPPFNTGKIQKRTEIKTIQSENGNRIGFQGKSYSTEILGTKSYKDKYDDFILFLEPRIKEIYRILAPTGSFFLHLNFREVHYAKIMVDEIFGRECFMNEIIWAYDYGGRPKDRWPQKHNTILWYAKDPESYTFNYDAIDRIPYMAPGLVGAEKAERGKTPTDVWWHTIVPTNGNEKTGYPNQKPLGILNRIIVVHSNPSDCVLDCFAGSGTTGTAAEDNARSFILIDSNLEAIDVMRKRFSFSMVQYSCRMENCKCKK